MSSACSEAMSRVLRNRYRVGEPLGAGGMGRVFAGEDLHTGRVVAIKLLRRPRLEDPAVDEQLALLRRIEHPHVVRVLDAGIADEGVPFLVMNRVQGRSLRDELASNGLFSLRRVREVGAQLLDGLAAIHAAGLVHGDLTAANIFVDVPRDDHVTVIDINATPVTRSDGSFTGTPEYVAPEVICGEPATPLSDVYAAAVVLYELIAGTTPFVGGTAEEVLERHLTERPVPVSQRCRERAIASELDQLLERGLEKDPRSRPCGAAELGHELRRAMPASYEDEPARVATFSTSSPTADWTNPTYELTAQSLCHRA
jgi:eukaryotic-like serine/threonine-protein kinase